MIRFILLFAACALIGTALDIGNELELLARLWAVLIGGSIFVGVAMHDGERQ